jgi:hypothetical protein
VAWRRKEIPGSHPPEKKIAVQGVKFLAQHVGQLLDDTFNSS